jgi:hypothetical protein
MVVKIPKKLEMKSLLPAPRSCTSFSRWWVIIAKRLINDISGGRLCNARSVVAKVEEHFKGKASKSFVLTPVLYGWLTYEFRHQVEVALTTFVATQRDKAYIWWLKTKKRIRRT